MSFNIISPSSTILCFVAIIHLASPKFSILLLAFLFSLPSKTNRHIHNLKKGLVRTGCGSDDNSKDRYFFVSNPTATAKAKELKCEMRKLLTKIDDEDDLGITQSISYHETLSALKIRLYVGVIRVVNVTTLRCQSILSTRKLVRKQSGTMALNFGTFLLNAKTIFYVVFYLINSLGIDESQILLLNNIQN